MNRIKMADIHVLLDMVNTVNLLTDRQVTLRINNRDRKMMVSLYGYNDDNYITFLKCFFVYPHGDEDDVTSYRECKQYLNQLLEEDQDEEFIED